MLVKIFFRMLHFGFVDEAHVPETAVGKLVNDGASQPFCQIVVYQGFRYLPLLVATIPPDIYSCCHCWRLSKRQEGLQLPKGRGINELSMAINKVMVQ